MEHQSFSEQREQAVSQHDLWSCPKTHGIQNISTKPTLWSTSNTARTPTGHNCSPKHLKNIFAVTEWSCIYFKNTWRSDSFWGKFTWSKWDYKWKWALSIKHHRNCIWKNTHTRLQTLTTLAHKYFQAAWINSGVRVICYQNNPAEFTLGKDLAAYFISFILRKKNSAFNSFDGMLGAYFC